MKYNFLKEFFEKSNLDTELISIYYDFEENNKSGFFVKNLVHSGLEQYGVSGGNKFILKDYYPGFYETCYDKNYRPTGFGIFDGNDRLKISKNLRSDQFNLFLNFKSYGCNSSYIDINVQNLNEPSGIVWNNIDFIRTGYNSGVKFIDRNSLTNFTKTNQITKITGNNGEAYDYFGNSISLNSAGNIALVGADRENINGATDAGSAYIFTGSGNSWAQAAKITGNDAQAGDQFGRSVSLNSEGNVALVGAYLEDPNGIGSAGSAYIFTGSGNSWVQVAKITGNDAQAGDQFGISVSLNSEGNVALVGAYLEDPNEITNAGSAYIFTGSGNSWVQVAKITGNDAQAFDNFGSSVSLNSEGNVALIGAYAEDPNGVFDAGSAYIFTGSGNSWVQTVKITCNDAQANDYFGNSASLNSDGNVALIGASFKDRDGTFDCGSAYIFDIFNELDFTKKITFNKTGISTNFSDWSYISGDFTGIIETGIESKLLRFFSGSEITSTNDFLIGKAQTLLNIKSLQNSAKPFDLKIGINNVYKLLIDFSGYNNENIYQSKTLTGELGNQNVASLSVNKNFITLCYNDFLANKNYCEQIDTSEDFFDQEIECYFGDNVGNYNKNTYTGYRGLIDDLFLISGSLTSEQKLQISKNLLKTGLYTGIQNSSNVAYNLLSSGYITTGIIGTGITGYELVESQQIINCQDNCIFYIKSGITGYLTGEIIEYRLVQPSGASTAGEPIEIDLYNSGDISNLFAKNYLIMYKPIDDKDLIEIQTYELNSNYLKDPEYSEGSSRFYTENINNNKILVFFNGVNISSGYFDIINSNTFIVNSYSKDDKDIVIYNPVPSGLVEYKFEYTGQDNIGDVTYAVGQTYNIFLNGQKLINNYNYYADNRITFNGEFLTINGDYLVYTEDIIINTGTIFETGELYIIEDNKLNSITGSNSNLLNINPDYGSNFVWLNGILQKEFEDHLFTSCNNNSIESYIKREGKSLEIFNREDNRFNII